jgi:hypothetical protein
MRRYDILFGSLLILSVIDFALAAPVLVQEKRQADADAVQIPKNVRTVLGKRVGDEDIAKLADYLETMGKPTESSDTHAPSSSAPPVPDREPTNPAPNPASSTADPESLTGPPIPLSASPPTLDDFYDFIPPWSDDDSMGYSSDTGYVRLPKQTPNPRPSTTDDWSTSAASPNPAPPTANLYSSIPDSVEPPWVSTFPDHFVPPWSDDESLGSGYSSGWENSPRPEPKPKPNPGPSTSTVTNPGAGPSKEPDPEAEHPPPPPTDPGAP